jgi:hypothetical protein
MLEVFCFLQDFLHFGLEIPSNIKVLEAKDKHLLDESELGLTQQPIWDKLGALRT